MGDSIALRLRCAAGVSTGTVTLRSTTAIRGAHRTLGTSAFACGPNATRTVHVPVRLAMRRLLRRHHRAAQLVASIVTRGDGSAVQALTPLALGAIRR